MTTWYCEERASAHCITRTNDNNFVFLLSFARGAMTRSIFYTLYCKKQLRRAYFLRHIAKGDDAIACKSMSFIARTQATGRHCDTRPLIARRMTMIVSFMLCRERSNNNNVFDIVSSGRTAREPITTVIQPL